MSHSITLRRKRLYDRGGGLDKNLKGTDDSECLKQHSTVVYSALTYLKVNNLRAE